MHNKRIRSLTVISLLAVLTLTSCDFGLMEDNDRNFSNTEDAGNYKPVQTKELTIKGTDFNDISYERYDDTHIQELIKECEGLIDDANNSDNVVKLFDEIEDEDFKLALSYEIAEIYNSKDATDKFYIEELEYAQKLLTSLTDTVCSLGKKILNSPCGDAARSSWDEADIKFYSEYVEMTDEQKKMREEEQSLILDYNELSVKEYKTTIDGKDYTLNDLYTEDDLSQDDYSQGCQDIMKQMNDEIGPIYVDLVKLRNKLAVSYGYENYTYYAYDKVYKREYTPEDSAKLCKEVKEYIMDTYNLVYDNYDYSAMMDLSEEMNDMSIAYQMNSVESYLPKINTVLPESFTFMKEYNLYDLEYTDTKMDSGFTTFLSVYNEPYLFNQPSGSFYDYMSLVHEFGHFNSYCVNYETAEQDNNLDLAEIHSQGLEMLYTNFYPEIFGESTGQAAIDYTILMKLSTITEGCLYDEFQQKVYAMENPTLTDINKAFANVSHFYGYDYSVGQEGYDWVQIPHNFQSPLYYISYTVSALPIFEIWETSLTDFTSACETYTRLVEKGEQEGYVTTLEDVGLKSPFEENYISEMAKNISSYY